MAHAPTLRSTDHELRLTMTYEEFLNSEMSETHAEWVDGEVTVFMPPTERHADVTLFLSMLLALYAGTFGLGKVFTAPFEMRVRPDRSFREPDVLFVARRHLDRLDGNRVNGPADLVVEVISTSSVHRDRVVKFAEYQMAGVPEYVMVDSRAGEHFLELFRLSADGLYRSVAADRFGRLHFETLPGFWLDVSWLRQESLPDPLHALATIAPDRFGMFASDDVG
ncbi:MAG TPA: Uma2 family endonuclease [Thermomicrobiales bacterium]|nr:Uma2 family endonuclease [Thermomicrobiales bacterium]